MEYEITLTEESKKATDLVLQSSKPGLGYRLFTYYVRFFHDVVYYRKIYILDKQNIPKEGPLMVVSNHQNSLNDALAEVLALHGRNERKVRAVTRADVFKNSGLARFFRWLGLMPAYRMIYDGLDTLAHNNGTFGESADELLNDGTVIIYPEAGHQDKRWLGKFTYGYLRILFEAAEKSNFEKEFFILPSCNHYSDYFTMQEDILIRYGTPISIKPFYELYQIKPRTAQRQVNALVCQQISDMMLNITDLENYEAIDYLRNTYGVGYAEKNGFNPKKLPEKLEADKQLVKELDKIKRENEKESRAIYKEASDLADLVKKYRIVTVNPDKKCNLFILGVKGMMYLLGCPLFVAAYLANFLIIFTPEKIVARIEDNMFHSTVRLMLSLMATIPVTFLLSFILCWSISGSLLFTLAYILCLPFLWIFATVFQKGWNKWRTEIRFYTLRKKGVLDSFIQRRMQLFDKLNDLLK